jgi:hypothetical protein
MIGFFMSVLPFHLPGGGATADNPRRPEDASLDLQDRKPQSDPGPAPVSQWPVRMRLVSRVSPGRPRERYAVPVPVGALPSQSAAGLGRGLAAPGTTPPSQPT